jgi:L-malate glycosyltransferase
VKNSALHECERMHAVHLLNDFSGSPLVFQIALNEWIAQGKDVHLYTATPSGNGFLSQVVCQSQTPIFYRWSPKKSLTLVYYLWAQWILFFRIIRNVQKGDVVYVNTLLPFGAMWAAKWAKAQLVVHIHEVSLTPALLKKFLVWSTEKCATEVIFVSAFVQQQYAFRSPKGYVVLNKLSNEFLSRIPAEKAKYALAPRTVLMLCSLKKYKGIDEFLAIARKTPKVAFELVLNASQEEVSKWMAQQHIPSNCICYPSQSDTHRFYARAAIVMNLSRPSEWLETFGMTILEGMAYGAFVIVPSAGAPKELIIENQNGKAIDGVNSDEISTLISEKLK